MKASMHKTRVFHQERLVAGGPEISAQVVDRRLALIARTGLGSGNYGERLNASGVTTTGALVELYEAPGGESWTLVLALPDGRACLIAAGNEWRPRKGASPRKGKGA